MGSAADGTIGLYSAVGDALAGRRLGFGRRRAAVAARFARHRGQHDAAVTATWFAGALAEIGLVDVTLPQDANEHVRLLAYADAPLYGARIVAALPGAPAGASDLVRWYREHDDGTGFPDRLRWDGIPIEAAALGVAHAFVEAMEDPEEPRGPDEAVFALMNESGRSFRVELVRTFRDFVGTNRADFDDHVEPALAMSDEASLLPALTARIDARDYRTNESSERLAVLAASIAERLALDASRAARVARLLALGRAVRDVRHDDFDPLSRFARERRVSDAARAARIAASVGGFADDAPLLAASAAWHEEGPRDPLAAVLALALAADALHPADAARRIASASGTQFDPAVVRAYLIGIGAAT